MVPFGYQFPQQSPVGGYNHGCRYCNARASACIGVQSAEREHTSVSGVTGSIFVMGCTGKDSNAVTFTISP